ncbi:restriction endonuclease [Pseudarthrobacter sp. H3Y2-7]|uniref:restriction endonuclease n=1 Tax=Pseudarthrobacter naphthalenicus TaxID=3031328 RepID=UPI0023AEFB4E|nr:restriction endonuclease [Pseudarthrobacter sp. H3Y2-7]MDE8670780.1 restriction endonuclease [Pseudarthrobacter sp. H3Y2-7]
MTAWIIRAGKYGEREQWALQKGLSGGGWFEVADLTAATTKDQVRAAVETAFPTASAGRIANFTGQLWAIRHTITPGDLVVMPLKTTKKIALGICARGYEYRADDLDPNTRHTLTVDWKTTDIPRAAIKDDLLNTINGAMTVFQASKNNAEQRLRRLLDTGLDPGNNTHPTPTGTATTTTTATAATGSFDGGEADDVVDPPAIPTLETIRDRVRTHLVENFRGHGLTELVAGILRVEGYVCEVSPPGPDQGVDIIAGRGPLGLDSPTLIVEVKSEDGSIGSPVVRGLQGAMSQHRADQCLLVAWGGLNKQARAEIRTDRLTTRVWDADDVLDHLFEVYDRLPDELRMRIRLTRAWVLDEETG